MDKARWQQIEAVFSQAVDLPPGEVSAYLDRACSGDHELRREVELLIDSDRKAQTPQESVVGVAIGHAAAAFAVQMQRDFSASQIGRRIGPYEIVREIGRGGMGSVYQAVRIDDQYIRSVAIKLMAHGMDTADALARFRTERQILATLQHPNIAALLDGGTTEDGRPYIVMEYIEGEPLIEYCERRQLSVNARLELFNALCGAVHHAHQMLVIHRDIKPGNVLVTPEGIPKLLDFGIAKLMTPELIPGGPHTTKTQMRRMTPQYASPEQIRGETLTTATDIYSLGVLLYEMLTQRSPYRITGETSQQVERLVCDSEPMRLSVAAQPNAKLRRQLAGDLENIVAMALRKEPQRRYASVQQFATDVQRFIDGLPVSARDDTMFYLAGKLVRRNKLASAAFAMLACSIVAGWFATYRQAERAEARFQEVRKLANVVLYDFHRSIQGLPGATPARELLVRTALQYLNSLSADAAHDLSLQWELSQAYEQIGDVQGDSTGPNLGHHREALQSYNKSLSLVIPLSRQRRDYTTLSCIAWLHYKCGDLELRTAGISSAVESYARGLEVSARTGSELNDSRVDELMLNGYMRMARAKTRMSATKDALHYAELAAQAADRVARKGTRHTITVQAGARLLLGNLLWLRGDLQAAKNRYEQAVQSLESLMAQVPENTTVLEQLSEAYRRSGDLQGNSSYFHFGDLSAAEMYYRKALKIAEKLAARDPNDAMARSQLSVSLRRLGAAQRYSRPAQASEAYSQALQHLQRLMREAPGDMNYQRDFANTQLGYAVALLRLGKLKLASEAIDRGLAMQKEIVARSPDRLVIQEDMFDSTVTLAEIQLAKQDFTSARNAINEAFGIAERLNRENAENLYSERCLALVYQKLGEFHTQLTRQGSAAQRRQNQEAANDAYNKALAIWSRWRSQNVAVPFSSDREKEVTRLRAKLYNRV